MYIGQHPLPNRLIVAPMAGVTDRPFRQLCKLLGAGYAVSEMVSSQPAVRASANSARRCDHTGESGLIGVQIAGTEPEQMAAAALLNIDQGAQIIDINMGCPVKKVCHKWAGSALMQNPRLARQIIEAVVRVSAPHNVPVTLKMRTGWCETQKNALQLAQDAQAAGVAMIAVHGRTRVQGYRGQAEHDTVAAVKACLKIPVVANGDIRTPEQAREVLAYTAADALMIGRGAQGRPWLFREINHFLATGRHLAAPLVAEVRQLLLEHLEHHYTHYGDYLGVRSARKHIAWYLRQLPGAQAFLQRLNCLDDAREQSDAVANFFAQLEQVSDRLDNILNDNKPQWQETTS